MASTEVKTYTKGELSDSIDTHRKVVSVKEKPVVLKVENVSKKFCTNLRKSMWYGVQDLAKGLVGIKPDTTTLRPKEFWALQDINFELREGEILGIIGANGSGKSTLLRVLTGIFPPDKGSVWMDGTVGGIIALGAGMHPHMTGRENIYLNGTILGMSKEEIDSKFDEIIDFAELGDFLEAPLSTYSSGMKVRLGFAVAVHCQPDILLVDEVLAVGDLSFQNKCLRKLTEIKETAKAVIFISHSMDNVELICNRVIVLNKSSIQYDGVTDAGIGKYQTLQNSKSSMTHNKRGMFEHKYLGLSRLKRSYATSSDGIEKARFSIFESFYLNFEIESEKSIKNPFISVALRDEKGNNIFWEMSQNTSFQPSIINNGKTLISVLINHPNLEPGKYYIVYALKDASTGEYHEKNVSENHFLVIEGEKPKRGVVILETYWDFQLISSPSVSEMNSNQQGK